MTTRLIIARHGNTFAPGEPPRRVGGRTDISLVPSGREQAMRLGAHFAQQRLIPDMVYSSRLRRAVETAEGIVHAIELPVTIELSNRFNEIDYGPDENQLEEDVIARIGKEAIRRWDAEAVVPEGWNADPEEIIQEWHSFANDCLSKHHGKNILVVTSNGIARFAPHITGDIETFSKSHLLKLQTGAFGVFEYQEDAKTIHWQVVSWNVRP